MKFRVNNFCHFIFIVFLFIGWMRQYGDIVILLYEILFCLIVSMR